MKNIVYPLSVIIFTLLATAHLAGVVEYIDCISLEDKDSPISPG